MTPRSDTPSRPDPAGTPGQGTRIFTSAELFGSDDEIAMMRNGATYRLRVTARTSSF
ncbi:MAG: hypothetical protein MO852_15430 [Candidatus Devosia euplotis]|nr:hypothetical protein [Candidatus Devosia euplotis]